jgi:hypothetical protein
MCLVVILFKSRPGTMPRAAYDSDAVTRGKRKGSGHGPGTLP